MADISLPCPGRADLMSAIFTLNTILLIFLAICEKVCNFIDNSGNCQTRAILRMHPGNPGGMKVKPAESGLALVEFIARRLGLSRNKAKGVIDQRRVFVNGRRIWMARHELKTGDRVAGSFEIEEQPRAGRVVILYEDSHYLVVNKPAGILSNGPGSMEELINRPGSVPAAAGQKPCLACHRIDKDTSGCLIFAKSAEARERIIPLFAANKVKKNYEAIVRGWLPEDSLTITTPIDGQKALTRIRLKKASQPASYLSVAIETGRTHQIRKHLYSIGHPVLGDQQYGGGRPLSPEERAITRQMLHAAWLEFVSPFTGKIVRVAAPLPADMKDCLRRYRLA